MEIEDSHDKRTSAIVIDDNLDAVEMFCDFLELNGIEVIGKGHDGYQAIELYKKFRPDIVFLDIMMPKYDGFFGLEQIRKEDKHSKIIMVTADVRSETTEKLAESKPNAIVYKPFDFDELMQTIDKVKNLEIVH
jgi:two-component system, chemotaxis family, chemotaxis protein CheY